LLFQELDHLPELADIHPLHGVGYFIDPLIGFFFDGDDGEARSGFSGTFNNEKRELAVAGDKAVFHTK
jgi:hypothetical protein